MSLPCGVADGSAHHWKNATATRTRRGHTRPEDKMVRIMEGIGIGSEGGSATTWREARIGRPRPAVRPEKSLASAGPSAR